MAQVFFLPSGRVVELNNNETIMKAAQTIGIDLGGFCNGNGTCKKCEVEIIEKGNKVKKVFACKYLVNDDVIVKSKDEVKLGNINDTEKFQNSTRIGVAIDIGTTSLVVSFYDMETKKEIKRVSELNRQVLYGADIISRIKYSLESDTNLKNLKDSIIDQINNMIGKLDENQKIENYVISGNTAMSHFLLGIKPINLGTSPFEPSYTGSKSIPSSDLGLIYDAPLYVVPNIKKHVGGDILSGILTLKNTKGFNCLVDIGTNGEIVVFDNNKMVCASTAMGPALEGAQISCGMRASSGAIEEVEIVNGKIIYKTIGGAKPIGICGSGIISCVYELLKAGLIDDTGRIIDSSKKVYIDKEHNIYISQEDIRKVQLAKAALYSGIVVLVNSMGKEVNELDNLFIAGEFGKHINLDCAIGIGLIPCINNIKRIGNSSLSGSSEILCNLELKEVVEDMEKHIRHIDLAEELAFTTMYTKSMWFSKN